MPLLLILCLALAVFMTAPGSAIAQNGDSNQVGCIVHTPKGWERQPVKWVGGCKNTYANGLGVLNRYENDKIAESFYGKMESGSLSLGVIDSDTGYIAGKFKDGMLEHASDRNTIIKAFETASRAASELSNRYNQEGDKTSAQFYRRQSEKLAQQMD